MQAHRVEPATYGSDNDVLALRGPCDPGHKVSGGSLVPEVNAEGGRQRVHHGDKGHKGYYNVELHADLQGVWFDSGFRGAEGQSVADAHGGEVMLTG